MKEVGYRVDTRPFIIEDLIPPRGEQFIRGSNLDLKTAVENLLKEHKPKSKPNRDGILMIFQNLEMAITHWRRVKGASLYEVEYDTKYVLHRGDYNKVEAIFKELQRDINSEKAIELAIDYWKELNIEVPELFVENASVTNVLGSDAERIELLKREMNIAPFERDTE
tara:strand:+ start:127 stop:627 length:501 start_codon:yes stop_codon:yes gene_type:complete